MGGNLTSLSQADKDQLAKELMLYIILRSENDDNFGATKLNKLMFFADFTSYLNTGKSLTNQSYIKQDAGPMLEKYYELRDDLISDGAMVVRNRNHYGYNQVKPIAIREPAIDLFTSRHIDLVNRLISQYWDCTAKKISDISHAFGGWKYARDYEEIIYEMALIGVRLLRNEEMEFGKTLADRATAALATRGTL